MGGGKVCERGSAVVPTRANRRVDQRRTIMSKQDARNCTKSSDAHNTNGKIDIFFRHEIEQSRKLRRFVSARSELENICAMCFGRARFGPQDARIWRGLKVMIRNDAPGVFPSGGLKQRSKRVYRAQFDVDITGTGQKAREQTAPLLG